MKKYFLISSLALVVLSSHAQGPGSGGNTNGSLNWRTSGNNVANSDFIGTLNQQSLIFKANNSQLLEMTSSGEIIFSKMASGKDGVLKIGSTGKAERIDFTSSFSHVLNGQGIFTDISALTGLKLSGNDIVQTSAGNVSLMGVLKLASDLYLPSLANGKDQEVYLDGQGSLKTKAPVLMSSCIAGAPQWSIGGDYLSGVINGGDLALGTCDANDLVFKANGIKRMWIENLTGNISISDNIPVNAGNIQKLNVAGSIFAQGQNGFATAGDRAYLYLGDGNHYISSEHSRGVKIGTYGNADILDIAQDGNVTLKAGANNWSGARLTMGPLNTHPDMDWGSYYMAFNGKRNFVNGGGNWKFFTDNVSNGGSVMWVDAHGNLYYSIVRNTGAFDQQLDDQDIHDRKALTVKWVDWIANPNGSGTTGNVQVTLGQGLKNTSPHLDYSLAVPGKVVCTSLYVTMANWADYVFDSSYQLMNLEDLEKFYKVNHHLPDVPTAQEILEKGNNLGETDAVLLRKIEENTLYIVQLQKQIEQQNKIISELSKIIEKK